MSAHDRPVRIGAILALAVALRASTVVAQQTTAAPATTAAGAGAELSLRPGDLIRLRIWREPDLSGDFRVTEEGVAVLPRLGTVTVVGRAPDSLRAEIIAGFTKFLAHSSIEVVLLRRVQVVGAVRTPGLYHADPTMKMGDVLALAGGANATGRLDRLELVRDGRRLPITLSARTLVAESPLRSGDQLYVPERSWISRNPGMIAAGLSALVSITIAVIYNR